MPLKNLIKSLILLIATSSLASAQVFDKSYSLMKVGGYTVTHNINLATHQWLARDHSWYESGQNNAPESGVGYSKLFSVPSIVGDPISITFRVDTTNTWRFIWQNRNPNAGVPNTNAMIQAHHWFNYSNGSSRVSKKAGTFSRWTYLNPPLGPYAGVFWDGTPATCGQQYPDEWAYQCYGQLYPCQFTACTGNSNSGTGSFTLYWSQMSEPEKQKFNNGMTMKYYPIVMFDILNSQVQWHTDHWWFNWSDIRATVNLTVEVNY